MSDQVKIELMSTASAIPQRSTEFSVGYDICSSEDEVIRPLSSKVISTGIKLHMPIGIEGQIDRKSVV